MKTVTSQFIRLAKAADARATVATNVFDEKAWRYLAKTLRNLPLDNLAGQPEL